MVASHETPNWVHSETQNINHTIPEINEAVTKASATHTKLILFQMKMYSSNVPDIWVWLMHICFFLY